MGGGLKSSAIAGGVVEFICMAGGTFVSSDVAVTTLCDVELLLFILCVVVLYDVFNLLIEGHKEPGFGIEYIIAINPHRRWIIR